MKRTKYFTYLLLFADDNNKKIRFYKVGETNSLEKRIEQLENTYNATCTEILTCFIFDTQEKALTMENVMRDYFKKKKYTRFTPKDRFKGRYPTAEDIESLDKKADRVSVLFD